MGASRIVFRCATDLWTHFCFSVFWKMWDEIAHGSCPGGAIPYHSIPYQCGDLSLPPRNRNRRWHKYQKPIYYDEFLVKIGFMSLMRLKTLVARFPPISAQNTKRLMETNIISSPYKKMCWVLVVLDDSSVFLVWWKTAPTTLLLTKYAFWFGTVFRQVLRSSV